MSLPLCLQPDKHIYAPPSSCFLLCKVPEPPWFVRPAKKKKKQKTFARQQRRLKLALAFTCCEGQTQFLNNASFDCLSAYWLWFCQSQIYLNVNDINWSLKLNKCKTVNYIHATSRLTALTVSMVFLPAGAASPWVSPGTCRYNKLMRHFHPSRFSGEK